VPSRSHLHPLPRRRHQVGVTHYFKMDKARRVLGYEVIVPHPVGMERTVARWADWHQKQEPSAASRTSVTMLALAVVVVAMIAVVVMQLLGVTQPSLVSVPLLSDW
jgi:hypothetical protein